MINSRSPLPPGTPRTGPRYLLALASVLLIGAAALAGCEASVSTGESAGGSQAEELITKQYEVQTGLALKPLSCETTDPEVGGTFTCEGSNSADVDVEITGLITEVDRDDDRFKFDWNVTKAIAAGATFAEPALARLRKDGQEVEVLACPDDIEIRKGNRVVCTATSADGDERDAQLILTDGDGGFRISVK